MTKYRSYSTAERRFGYKPDRARAAWNARVRRANERTFDAALCELADRLDALGNVVRAADANIETLHLNQGVLRAALRVGTCALAASIEDIRELVPNP